MRIPLLDSRSLTQRPSLSTQNDVYADSVEIFGASYYVREKHYSQRQGVYRLLDILWT